jgi:hypothetical protein
MVLAGVLEDEEEDWAAAWLRTASFGLFLEDMMFADARCGVDAYDVTYYASNAMIEREDEWMKGGERALFETASGLLSSMKR